MKYAKIKILECRDNAAFANLQQAAAELVELEHSAEDANRHADEIEKLAGRSHAPADLELAAGERAKANALASAILAARMKAKQASEMHRRMAFSHRMVGTFGYQEIDPIDSKVIRLLDEAGNPFPPDMVFGYDIADANPPFPAWGISDTDPSS